MELVPAIDIIEGKCVRLTKGDYDTKKVYGDPLEMAQKFEDLGLRRLHVVDLDGAKSKHVVNLAALKAITSHTSLIVDFGGGVKSDDDLERAYDAGATMVTVGSIAITDPDRYLGWLEKYGAERLILGADVRNGRVSINGWKEDSDVRLEDFLLRYMKAGTKNVLCTEISRDGTLEGPAIELYKSIMARYPECYLIASGGVGSTEDILALEAAGIPAVVFGKAYYEGHIDMKKLRNLDNKKVSPRGDLEGVSC
ncbi:MAG: 1-(5-phosphoribosyl)-5-[Bacteroidaceae bacterium]|nr:1-(5-phosphoribosyl)-5-[(5-phosphoribosylamino)methylideneamino]imidazole-4-carboxamide isomerase [Bacteroidaceae bacterium]